MSENEIKVNEEERDERKQNSYIDPVLSFFNNCLNDMDASELMKTDVFDDGDNYHLLVELPGVDKKDVKLAIEKGYLTIAAKCMTSFNGYKMIRRERFAGSFKRSFYLGDNVLKEDIQASMENGLLHITVAKAKERKDQEKFIDIQ